MNKKYGGGRINFFRFLRASPSVLFNLNISYSKIRYPNKKYSANNQSPAKSIRFSAILTVISADNMFIQYANRSS